MTSLMNILNNQIDFGLSDVIIVSVLDEEYADSWFNYDENNNDL